MSNLAKSDEDVLRQLPHIFSTAVNGNDAYQLAEIMADDVDYVNVAAAFLHSRDSVEKHHIALFTGLMSNSVFEPLQISIRPVRSDIAIVNWSWTAYGDKAEDGSEKPRRYGIMTMVAEKQPVGWKVIAVQNTNSMPGFGPAPGIVSPMPIPDHPVTNN